MTNFEILNKNDKITTEAFQTDIIKDWKRGSLCEMPYWESYMGSVLPTPETVKIAGQRYHTLIGRGADLVATTETGRHGLRDSEALHLLKKVALSGGKVCVMTRVGKDILKGAEMLCWKTTGSKYIILLRYREDADLRIARLEDSTGLTVKYHKPSAVGYCYSMEIQRNGGR